MLTPLLLLTTLLPILTLSNPLPFTSANTPTLPYTIHNTTIDNLTLFYREAGSPTAPTVLLLHGFPSSSHQYRHLIPLLSQKYHVLAPDFPGFGFTTVSTERNYTYTFDALARTTSLWLEQLRVTDYAVYIFDYGAPVGFRLALEHPERVKAIISQNGNAYVEGFGPAWPALADYYNDPANKTAEATARGLITYDTTRFQYTNGADTSVIEPESYTLDWARLSRPGQVDIQLALFRDYKTNEDAYPTWHAYLRKYQPPVLAMWGENDVFFIPPGATAFKNDVKDAEVVLVDGGHFLLETDVIGVGEKILDFLARKGF